MNVDGIPSNTLHIDTGPANAIDSNEATLLLEFMTDKELLKFGQANNSNAMQIIHTPNLLNKLKSLEIPLEREYPSNDGQKTINGLIELAKSDLSIAEKLMDKKGDFKDQCTPFNMLVIGCELPNIAVAALKTLGFSFFSGEQILCMGKAHVETAQFIINKYKSVYSQALQTDDLCELFKTKLSTAIEL